MAGDEMPLQSAGRRIVSALAVASGLAAIASLNRRFQLLVHAERQTPGLATDSAVEFNCLVTSAGQPALKTRFWPLGVNYWLK
jgi:hypothetical protein